MRPSKLAVPSGRTSAALLAASVIAAGLPLASCESGWKTEEQVQADRAAMDANVDAAIAAFRAADPGIERFFREAYAYAVFPSVGAGALIVGGGGGEGLVFQGGRRIGRATMSFGTVGAQIGGQSFREIIFFENAAAFEQFKSNQLEFRANASAVAATAGASATANYADGVAVFTLAEAGLMLEAAIGGQRFQFYPD